MKHNGLSLFLSLLVMGFVIMFATRMSGSAASTLPTTVDQLWRGKYISYTASASSPVAQLFLQELCRRGAHQTTPFQQPQLCLKLVNHQVVLLNQEGDVLLCGETYQVAKNRVTAILQSTHTSFAVYAALAENRPLPCNQAALTHLGNLVKLFDPDKLADINDKVLERYMNHNGTYQNYGFESKDYLQWLLKQQVTTAWNQLSSWDRLRFLQIEEKYRSPHIFILGRVADTSNPGMQKTDARVFTCHKPLVHKRKLAQFTEEYLEQLLSRPPFLSYRSNPVRQLAHLFFTVA